MTMPSNREADPEFDPTPGWNWVTYSVRVGVEDEGSQAMAELIENELLHLLLGTSPRETDFSDYAYNIIDASLFVFAMAHRDDTEHEQPLTKLLEETSDHWTHATISLAYRDDSHGETAVFESPFATNEVTLDAYFEGEPEKFGWDASFAAEDVYGVPSEFVLPDVLRGFGRMWPLLGEENHDVVDFDPYVAGTALPNHVEN